MPHVFEFTSDRQQAIDRVAGLEFYHSYTLSNGLHIPGWWDVSRSIDSYPFPSQMKGMRVLDIGPASGWFSFYFEQLGADVTVVETRGRGDFDRYGDWRYHEPDRAPDRTWQEKPVWFAPLSASFWAMHDLFSSQARWVNGRAYDVSPALFPDGFDLVFMGHLLLHLRDPVGALRAARSVCRGTCVVTTLDWLEHESNPYPVQQLPWTHLDRYSWWMPNKAALAHWMLAAGFHTVDVDRRLIVYPDLEKRDATGRIVNVVAPSRIAVGWA